MEATIKQLILKRFRSVPADQIDFENPTFLVGRNGAGKSNLVDAFVFLSDAVTLSLKTAFDMRGGITVVRNKTSGQSYPPNLGLGVVFGAINGSVTGGRYAFEVKALPNYGFEVLREQCELHQRDGNRYWFERKKDRFTSNAEGLNPAVDPSALTLPIVGGDARFAPALRTLGAMRHCAVEPAKLRQMQDPDSGVTLRPDGGNAASVLQEIERRSEDDMERICETLASIVPNTVRVHTKKHGNKISLEFTQEWGEKKRLKFDAFNMSDGTLRALGMLIAVYQRPSPPLLAIEEPEATIHPGALGSILDLIRHASRNMQVIITTHSPEVLDAKWIDDRHIRVVDWQEGATHITCVSDATRAALQQHLMGAGELLRSNALEPEPLFKKSPLAQDDLFKDLS